MYRFLLLVLPVGVFLLVFSDSMGVFAAEKAAKSSKAKSVREADFNKFLIEADKSRTPESAIAVLRAYRAANELTAKQGESLQKQLDKYAQYQRDGLCRHGGKWRTSAEIKDLEQKAEKFIELAYEQMQAGNAQKTLDFLDRASSADPGGIRADFIVGMLYCLHVNPKLAADRFETVLRRVPDYGPARNNLAVCQIKLLSSGRYNDAIVNFRKAAELMPNSLEVLQNVNRVVAEARQEQLPLPLPVKGKPALGKQFTNFENLASQLNERAAKQNLKFDPRVGWLYAPFMKLKPIELGAEQPQEQVPVKDAGPMIASATGTGFVIAPGYLLTNRHVVAHDALGVADQVSIRRPDAAPDDRPVTVSIAALALNHDLALLHAPDVAGTPIPLGDKPAPRGREILVLGYPKIDLLGATLKTTRGVITGLPDGKRFQGMLLMDAEANPGNSGGPVCDRTGQLVGVVTAILVDKTIDYSLAIPNGDVANFLSEQNVELAAFEPGDDAADWSIIDERVSPAVYLIESSYRTSPLRFREVLPDKLRPNWSEFEDVSCANCSGRGHKACPAPNCVAGSKMETQFNSITLRYGTFSGTFAAGADLKVSGCAVCDGVGRIKCGICKGKGIDPDLNKPSRK